MATNNNEDELAETLPSRSVSVESVELSRQSEPTSSEASTSESSEKQSTDNSVDLIEFNERPSGTRSRGFEASPQAIDPFNLAETIEKELSLNKETIEIPATKDEAISAVTPTIDHMVQTSRRATINMFECKYGYHFATSPTSSMISELAREVQKSNQSKTPKKTRQVGYGKSKLVIPSSEDEQLDRLVEMFPTATKQVIEHMIKIYQGREGLIKAALISMGYKRSTEYNNRQTTAQSPIMLMMAKPASKKLFDKLVGYFPEKDENLIKELMYMHKEVEHEIISALVESDASRESRTSRQDRRHRSRRLAKDGVIMKLRYLKSLFPSCDETEIYHLLHINDLNAQTVIGILETMGHKKVNIDEVIKGRKSQAQKMRAQQQAMAASDKTPGIDLVQAHKSRTKPNVSQIQADNMKENIKKSFEQFPDGLVLRALECADYNEQLAKKFLEDMGTFDESLYEQRYEIQLEHEPDVVRFPCKGTQKDESDSVFVTVNDFLDIPRDIVESINAVALLKTDTSTFTGDDFEVERFTHRIGRSEALCKGSMFGSLDPRDSLRKGPSSDLAKGSNYNIICSDESRTKPETRAMGRIMTNFCGANANLVSGHNPLLVKRIHPFFLEPKARQRNKLKQKPCELIAS